MLDPPPEVEGLYQTKPSNQGRRLWSEHLFRLYIRLAGQRGRIDQKPSGRGIKVKESRPRGSGFGPPRRGDVGDNVNQQCAALPLRYRRDL